MWNLRVIRSWLLVAVSLTLGLAILVAGAQPVTAAPQSATTGGQSPPAPGLVPNDPGPHGYFELSLNPGQSRMGSVVLSDPSSTGAIFDVYPVDAVTSAATGVAYSGLGDAPTSAGSWVHLDLHSVALQAHQSRSVTFQVSVPPRIHPGDYVAGIAAQNPTAAHQGGSTGLGVGVSLAVDTRVVVAVVIHVPGPAATAIQLGRPRLAAQNGVRQVVELPMTDNGGLLAKPELSSAVRRCTGGPNLASITRQLDTFVPHTTITYVWSLATLVLSPGCYRISATLSNLGNRLSSVTTDAHLSPDQAKVLPIGSRKQRQTNHGISVLYLAGGTVAAAGVVMAFGIATLRSRRRRRALEQELALMKQGAASSSHGKSST